MMKYRGAEGRFLRAAQQKYLRMGSEEAEAEVQRARARQVSVAVSGRSAAGVWYVVCGGLWYVEGCGCM